MMVNYEAQPHSPRNLVAHTGFLNVAVIHVFEVACFMRSADMTHLHTHAETFCVDSQSGLIVTTRTGLLDAPLAA